MSHAVPLRSDLAILQQVAKHDIPELKRTDRAASYGPLPAPAPHGPRAPALLRAILGHVVATTRFGPVTSCGLEFTESRHCGCCASSSAVADRTSRGS